MPGLSGNTLLYTRLPRGVDINEPDASSASKQSVEVCVCELHHFARMALLRGQCAYQ